MADSMKALYTIAFVSETSGNQLDTHELLWLKSNQNRLNQNFSILVKELELLEQRLSVLEAPRA